MKIAILGAPGAGKSKLARSLVRKLGPDWKIVDGYVDRLVKRTGLPFGPVDNRYGFISAVQVLGERWTLEQEALHAGFNTITCGTIFETLIYAAAQSLAIARIPNEQLMLEETRIAETMMAALGLLSFISFDYGVLFYLPLEQSEHNWNGVVNLQLPAVLEGQFKQAITLNDKNHQQKVAHAQKVIEQISAAMEAHDRSTVGRSGDIGKSHESEPEKMPDVSSETD